MLEMMVLLLLLMERGVMMKGCCGAGSYCTAGARQPTCCQEVRRRGKDCTIEGCHRPPSSRTSTRTKQINAVDVQPCKLSSPRFFSYASICAKYNSLSSFTIYFAFVVFILISFSFYYSSYSSFNFSLTFIVSFISTRYFWSFSLIFFYSTVFRFISDLSRFITIYHS